MASSIVKGHSTGPFYLCWDNRCNQSYFSGLLDHPSIATIDNNGIVTGIARVVENIEEIHKLQVGDILVTKFTDTGWTSKFAILKGIVTECGGILCHGAIVAREYGIPCIVSCYDITKKIKDGSQITINGATGQVFIAD